MQKMSKSGTALCAKNPSFSSLLAELSKRAEAVKSGMGMVTAPLSTMSPSSGSTINQPPTSPEAQMMGAAPPTGPQAGNPAGAASCRERRKPCCFSSGWRRRNQCRQLAGPLCVPGSRRGEFPSAADRTSVAGARAAGGSLHSNDAGATGPSRLSGFGGAVGDAAAGLAAAGLEAFKRQQDRELSLADRLGVPQGVRGTPAYQSVVDFVNRWAPAKQEQRRRFYCAN